MPFFEAVAEIESYALNNCQPYEQRWWTQFLVLFHYASLFVTALTLGLSFRYKELYLLLFGLGLSADTIINWLLRQIIRQEAPLAGCGVLYAMPSQQTQHAAFLVVFAATFAYVWRARFSVWHMALALGFLDAVVLSALYFNFASEQQVLVGAVIGGVLALVWQFFIYLCLFPHWNGLLRAPPIYQMGYEDTLLRSAD